MTVQELIDLLNKVEDKTKRVYFDSESSGIYDEVAKVIDSEEVELIGDWDIN